MRHHTPPTDTDQRTNRIQHSIGYPAAEELCSTQAEEPNSWVTDEQKEACRNPKTPPTYYEDYNKLDHNTHLSRHHTHTVKWGEASNPGPSVKTEFSEPVHNRYRNDYDPEDVKKRNEENSDPIMFDEESEEEAAEITNTIHDLRQPTDNEMKEAIDKFQQSMDQHQEEVQFLMDSKYRHLPDNDPQPTRRYASKAHATPKRISYACVTSINLTSLDKNHNLTFQFGGIQCLQETKAKKDLHQLYINNAKRVMHAIWLSPPGPGLRPTAGTAIQAHKQIPTTAIPIITEAYRKWYNLRRCCYAVSFFSKSVSVCT